MMRVAVCDEHLSTVEKIDAVIGTYAGRASTRIEVGLFDQVGALRQQLAQHAYFDLIFLGIKEKGADIMDFGRFIRTELDNHTTQLIYFSSEIPPMEVWREARNSGFLKKPLLEKDIVREIQRMEKLLGFGEKTYAFQKNGNLQKVLQGDILYFSSRGRKVLLATDRNVYEFYAKLDQVEQELANAAFIRIHKSYLVNDHHIREYHGDKVRMSNQEQLPISERRSSYVKEAVNFLQGKIRTVENRDR